MQAMMWAGVSVSAHRHRIIIIMRHAHITLRRQLFIIGRRQFISATTAMHRAITTIVLTHTIEAMEIRMAMGTGIADTAVDIEAIVD